ncbi:MAG TPA: MFS transporter [Solirubrobacteraceae bacterium]|nr:MFS transporter [Solirubrobacteraceae bacterium]
MTDAQHAERRKWIALALLASTQFVIVLDAAIVNVAIPSIGEDLQFSREDLAWIPNAYALTFGGFLLLGGRMADLLGRRRLFMGGLILFVVASLLGGFSQSETQLIAARALQGLGAALLAPSALSMVTTIFTEGAERNKALGVWGAVSGSGGAAGVLLGGVLTEYAGWEWVLWVNVPIGLIAAFLAPRLLDESMRESETRHFDALGAVVVTAGLSLLVFALVDTVRQGWESAQTIGLLGLSLALILVFVAIERRSIAPLVPFRIFRLRTLTGANVIGLMLGSAIFSMFFFLSRYMQEVLLYSPLKTGLSYLPLALVIIVSAGVASVLVTKLGFKPVLIAGLVLVLVGLLWFAQLPVDGVYLSDIVAPMVISAFGLGFAFVPVTIAAVSGISHDDSGLASGLINTSQQIGGALGLAVLATIASSTTLDLVSAAGATGGRAAAAAATPGALTEGFQDAFLAGAGFAALGIVAALVMIRSADSRALVGANPAELPVA